MESLSRRSFLLGTSAVVAAAALSAVTVIPKQVVAESYWCETLPGPTTFSIEKICAGAVKRKLKTEITESQALKAIENDPVAQTYKRMMLTEDCYKPAGFGNFKHGERPKGLKTYDKFAEEGSQPMWAHYDHKKCTDAWYASFHAPVAQSGRAAGF